MIPQRKNNKNKNDNNALRIIPQRNKNHKNKNRKINKINQKHQNQDKIILVNQRKKNRKKMQ